MLLDGIKKIGLLHDDGPNTVGQMLSGHARGSFFNEEGEIPNNSGSDAPTKQEDRPAGVFMTWSWDPQPAEGSSSWTFPSNQYEETESSSATSSDEGDLDETQTLPGIEGMSEQDAHEHVFYQYRNAKRVWRRLTGRPVR